MKKFNITWRTFDDDGTINRQWNSYPTPAFFIIDHQGIIRHKWVGKPSENAIDAALEKLINNVPETGRD